MKQRQNLKHLSHLYFQSQIHSVYSLFDSRALAVKYGVGNGVLQSVHKSSCLPRLPSHFIPCSAIKSLMGCREISSPPLSFSQATLESLLPHLQCLLFLLLQ